MEGGVDWEGRWRPEGRMERGWAGHCREGCRPSKKQVALAGSVRREGMQDRGTDGLAPSLPSEAWRCGQPDVSELPRETEQPSRRSDGSVLPRALLLPCKGNR